MKFHLLNRSENEGLSPSGEQEPEKPLEPKQEPNSVQDLSVYSLPKMCSVVHMNPEALFNINTELLSLGQLA